MRDFKRLQEDPPAGVSGAPGENNIMLWNAVIFGPHETPFEVSLGSVGKLFLLAVFIVSPIEVNLQLSTNLTWGSYCNVSRPSLRLNKVYADKLQLIFFSVIFIILQ